MAIYVLHDNISRYLYVIHYNKGVCMNKIRHPFSATTIASIVEWIHLGVIWVILSIWINTSTTLYCTSLFQKVWTILLKKSMMTVFKNSQGIGHQLCIWFYIQLFLYILNILFLSNHNVHKSLCGHCFLGFRLFNRKRLLKSIN